MDILYLVMPAYNEEENIKNTILSWYPVLAEKDERSRLVIADSGSTDRTHDILEELMVEYPKLEVLPTVDKQHGPKLIALYDYAIKKGADFIFQTDSDGQTDPTEVEAFWDNRYAYDAVLGYRKVRGDGKARAFVEHVVCLLLRVYFGVKVPDANAPFRLMKTELVRKYLYKLPNDYNLPNIMLTTYFAYYKEQICFQVISFAPRRGGTNSINLPKIAKIGWKALHDFRKLRKEMII